MTSMGPTRSRRVRMDYSTTPVETPAVGNALQLVLVGIPEHEPGTRDEVLDGLGDQDLRGVGPSRDPGPYRHGETAGLPVDKRAPPTWTPARISTPSSLTRAPIFESP